MVIGALAEKSQAEAKGKSSKAGEHIPYRDSTLTFLLKVSQVATQMNCIHLSLNHTPYRDPTLTLLLEGSDSLVAPCLNPIDQVDPT